MRQKHIGIIINHGPEVRLFIHSGLVEALRKNYEVTVFTRYIESGVFSALKTSNVVLAPSTSDSLFMQRIRGLAYRIHHQWLKHKGKDRWKHSVSPTLQIHGIKASLYRIIASVPFLVPIVLYVERRLASIVGTNAGWKEAFSTANIDCVIVASYGSERTLSCIQTASNIGLSSIVILNSWKDVYSHPYLAVRPTKIVVWSQLTACDLKYANPHIAVQQIVVISSLHLECFLNPDRILDRHAFFELTGLDPSREYICYTAAAPNATRCEELIVESILHAIKQGQIAGGPQLLLRTNPMENRDRFEYLVPLYPDDLVIQTPIWEWDEANDWCCALEQDIDTWISTVHYAKLNVSIPSTVSMEFLTFSRPIVNICYDAVDELQPYEGNLRFWHADFYSELRPHRLIRPAFSEASLFAEISAIIRATHEQYPTSIPNSRSLIPPVRQVIEMLEEVLV